ncbi:MAG: putative sulfate/molybdate transporter [Halobaculum sp.]
MSLSHRLAREQGVSLTRGELTGALGDSVTVLPVVVGVAALTELTLPAMLLAFAVFQVIWGLHYGLPISVEPMKALAALVIAGGVLLLAGGTGLLAVVDRVVSRPVVRGVQLAVALLLLGTAVDLGLSNVPLAVAAVAVAGAAAVVGIRRSVPLVVLGFGVAVALVTGGVPTPQVPTVRVMTPTLATLSPTVLDATLAQLAMTVGNAAVATALLLGEYYDADVTPDELARSMGVMNLLAVPVGAIPMCHGSGGVAGKHAFGARTAGANLILGVGYAAVAVLAAGVVAAFPMATLGVLLAAVALELGRTSLDSENLRLTVAVGVVGAVTNVGVAFLLGAVVSAVRRREAVRTVQ